MSKGGNTQQQQPTTSTVNQSNLPEYVEPYFTGLLNRTEDESFTGYTPYQGQRLAGFGAETQTGLGQLAGITQQGTPQEFTDATGALTGIAQAGPLQQQSQFGGVATYANPNVAARYMNPYITNVLDTRQRRLQQRFDESQLGRDASAVGAGAFSNTRRGVEDAIAQRELGLQQNELDAQGYAQAYQTGADIFGQERAADLQNRALNTDVFGQNQQRILAQQQNQMAAAQQLGVQGAATDAMATDRAKTLAGIGGAYDDLFQQRLDVGYTDFLNQRDYGKQQLNFLSGILRGVPVTPTQESTVYQAPPSQTSQLLGLGVGGLGLLKAMQGKPT